MRLLTFAICATSAAAAVAADVKVSIPGLGELEGFTSHKEKVDVFWGVPFAAPPVGELRWKPPQEQAPWNGTLKAKELRHSCMQGSNPFTYGTTMSEDCLYLNIYVPRQPVTKPIPVILFFYGGSWETGAASCPLYWGGADVKLAEDVIIVAANYRLNAFSCVASQSLRALDAEGSTGNIAIKDQRKAMQWVQDNIAAFGGDGKKVTILGESAGAGSVSGHLTNPRSWPYFQAAAMESGPPAIWTAAPYDVAEIKYVKLATNAGCANESMSVAEVSASVPVLNCLRALNTTDIMKANHGMPGGILRWAPVIDGVEFKDKPENLARAGQFPDVPIMFGSNRDEGTGFNPPPYHLKPDDYESWVYKHYGQQMGGVIIEHYPADEYRSPYWAATHALGDAAMSCPARRSARWFSKNKSPVFIYFYVHELEAIKLAAPQLGVFHGSELVQVFHATIADLSKEEKGLADQVVRYWSNFGAFHDPNGDYSSSDPVWPAYENATDLTLALDVPGAISNVTALKKDLCQFWEGEEAKIPDWVVWGYPPRPDDDTA